MKNKIAEIDLAKLLDIEDQNEYKFHPDGKDVWLFGGIFEKKSLKRPPGGKQGHFYDVLLTEKGQEYIGRLKIIADGSKTRNYPYLTKVYHKLKFSEILETRYGCNEN